MAGLLVPHPLPSHQPLPARWPRLRVPPPACLCLRSFSDRRILLCLARLCPYADGGSWGVNTPTKSSLPLGTRGNWYINTPAPSLLGRGSQNSPSRHELWAPTVGTGCMVRYPDGLPSLSLLHLSTFPPVCPGILSQIFVLEHLCAVKD